MRLVLLALLLPVLAAAPLLVVGLLDPTANPIGLGLLFMAAAVISPVRSGSLAPPAALSPHPGSRHQTSGSQPIQSP